MDEAVVSYDFDGLNRLTRRSLSTTGAALDTALAYLAASGNETGLVSRYQNKVQDGAVLQQYDYEYDDNGNITNVTDAAGTTTYTYDGLGRLTRAKTTWRMPTTRAATC